MRFAFVRDLSEITAWESRDQITYTMQGGGNLPWKNSFSSIVMWSLAVRIRKRNCSLNLRNLSYVQNLASIFCLLF